MKAFRRILSYARPYSRFWPGYLIFSILSVIFGVVNYALIKPLLEVLFDPDAVEKFSSIPEFSLSVDYFYGVFQYYLTKVLEASGVLRGLLFVCLVLIITSFLSNLTRFLSQKILVNMKTYVMKNIRTDLFNKITRLNVDYFQAQRKGDILSSVSNDVNEVQNSVASSFHIIFREPLLVLGFLAGLFYMSPKLTLLTLLTLPISAFVIGAVSRKLKRGATRTQALMGRIISHFEEAISGIRIIKAFNAQKYVRDNFDKTNEEHKSVSRAMYTRQELASPLSEFLGISVAAAVLFYGGILQMRGELGMSLSGFIVYIAFYWRVLEPSKAIAAAYSNIQKGLVSGNRIFAILDAVPSIKKAENPVHVSEFKGSIEYRHVSFKYSADYVLKDIDLTIPKGRMIAVVGPSGAGKSTLADLLPRFYDVTDGSITIDGIDIRQYYPKELISLMGIVTQEAILFNDTVRNNITFGMENVSDEDVKRAARIANADEFIMQMENGYDTNIGDRGGKLSGGQRQRIAIARAVLKNPPILILDEATSALDTESERLVQDALTNLMKNRTSIVIAHRLSTIQHADEIVVMKEGRIVEKGTHAELIKAGGLYSHLCDMQTF
ncbi:MAG TPA: ABC transporter ATP-binding protein/permease [Candidatus Coprenecus stercoravium]|uniref:ABC transporter ATP-binding protein/permease n=1 Tax=Candidatus Coprenecus stercoravium TaxID=2840735 RepID=A0A9D2GQ79_9BACT|nr:ABC transporter ATP-binding protein/permease [Candidatus Coprenecus stercoravium]